MALQRTFSGFPTGYPGLALLLLRLAVGGVASSQAWLIFASSHGSMSVRILVALLALAMGLALILGFMTPVAGALLVAGTLFIAAHSSIPGQLPLFESGIACLEFVVMSVALIFLGPGALSLDARLYGRREIKVNGNGS